MAASIRDVVQSNMPETFKAVFDDGSVLDVEDGLDLVDFRTGLILDHFWPDGSMKESSLTQFQVAYLGDIVTRLVIPAAIDYYGVRTGRSDSTQPGSPGLAASQRGAGTGRQNYDRIQMLKDLDSLIAARLAAQLEGFLSSVGVTPSAGMQISSSKDDLITTDPRIMPYARFPYYGKAQQRALFDLGVAIDGTGPFVFGAWDSPWWISPWLAVAT